MFAEKGGDCLKRVLSILLCLAVILCLSGCVYHPPAGWTKSHHSYEEVLAFAKSIDANAVVDKEYTDSGMAGSYDYYREWNAVINGVPCHVASVSYLK